MSITNTLFPNEIDLRARKSIFEEVWTKAVDSEEYIRLIPGGGGTPGELPYYLKANSIKVDGGDGSETLVTSNLITTQAAGVTAAISPSTVSVENSGNSTGSELSSTALTFGDTAGNVSLTKLGVDTVSRLQTSESATVLNNAVGTLPIVYNPITKAFNQSRALQLLSADGNTRTNITTASFRSDMPNNPARFFMSGISAGVTHNEALYRLFAGAFASGIVHRNTTTNKGSVMKEDSVTVGDVNGDAISTTGNWGKLAESSLSFKDSSGTVVLDKGDVGVTNKLKALTAATSGANSKMLIYDTGTSAFNYTDIPSGGAGVLPSYLQDTYIRMQAPTNGYIEINGGATNDAVITVSNTGTGTYPSGVKLRSTGIEFRGGGPTGVTLDAADVRKLKRLQEDQFTSWVAPPSSSLTVQNVTSVSGGTITGYTGPLYRFPTMDRVGNTLWVDLGTWALPILTGAANARGFCIQLGVHDSTPSPAVSVSYSNANLAVTWAHVYVRKDATSTLHKVLFVKFQNNGGSTVTANGVVRIKIEAPSTIDYSSIISTTPESITV